MAPVPVKPAHGPTLPELLGRRSPRAARALPWLVAGLAVVAVFVLLAAGTDERSVVVDTGAVDFNLRHPPALEPARGAPGDLLHLEQRRDGGLFLQSFTVRPLVLSAYRGQPSGALPVAAERLRDRLQRTVRDFHLVEEGRTRINQTPGYTIAYTGRTESGRRLYARRYLMVPDLPGARRGVQIILRATPASGVPGADDLGSVGSTKLPLRSFRFGTESP